MGEPRKKYTEQELNALRQQLYSLDHGHNSKTILIKLKTDEALLEIGRRLHTTEDKTYDFIIMSLVDEYLKTRKEMLGTLPAPSVFSTTEEIEK